VLVSVVIPNHNGDKYIAECIESVLSQTYKDIEIIVVDDHSNDQSVEQISKYSGKLSLRHSSERGAAFARNLGIQSTQGTLIALLDSDDVWEPTKLEKQVELIESKNLGLVYCNGEEFGLSVTDRTIHNGKFQGDCYKDFELNPGVSIVELGCSTALIRKKLFNEVGFFDTNFRGAAEDWDMFRRICKVAKIGFVDEILIQYRRHENSISARDLSDFIKGNEMAVRKLIVADETMSVKRSRICWAKLQRMILKTSIKQFQPITFFRSIFFLRGSNVGNT
jgi:glycosyltransferase involved in cell wall biosynthesis